MSQNGGIASTNVFHCAHTNPCMLMIANSHCLGYHKYYKQQETGVGNRLSECFNALMYVCAVDSLVPRLCTRPGNETK